MVAFLQRDRKFSNALLLRIPLRQMQAAVAVLNGPLKAGEGFIFKFVPQFAKMKFCKNGLERTNDSKVLFTFLTSAPKYGKLNCLTQIFIIFFLSSSSFYVSFLHLLIEDTKINFAQTF